MVVDSSEVKSYDPVDFRDCAICSKGTAIRVLCDLLEYEGGHMQSTSEASNCSINNAKIAKYAKEKLGVELNYDHLK